ncbi:MAG: type II secretion system F family protein, partial [Alphaproteobacteria bacterium]|nr:type II secretion system F family protein [Alphaproteobacteria bacterium]
MPNGYQYEALDTAGQRARGRIAARDKRDALRLLHGKGLFPITLAPEAQQEVGRISRPISHQDYILTLKQLALLLNAGVPLVQSVATLKSQGIHPGLERAFADVERRLRSGENFTSAFATALSGLPAYVGQLAAAGEAIGRLGTALADAVKQMEYEHQVRIEFRNALTYPAFLVAAGLSAVLFIFIVVVPRFSAMLDNTKQKLPLISSIVLETGVFLNQHLVAVLVIAALFVVATVLASRDPALRAKARELLATAPLVGAWLRESDMAAWASLLSTMLGNGVDLIKALSLARDGVRIPRLAT